MEDEDPMEWRPLLRELNPHLCCSLCAGYLIDAMASTPCLHAFCKSCIVKYLRSRKDCPVCSRDILQISRDTLLQTLVYKLVPGLYQGEAHRRLRHLRGAHGNHQSNETRTSEEGNEEEVEVEEVEVQPREDDEDFIKDGEKVIMPDDSVSLALQFRSQSPVAQTEEEASQKNFSNLNNCSLSSQEKEEQGGHGRRRYLQCPAAVKIRHLCKLLALKLGIAGLGGGGTNGTGTSGLVVRLYCGNTLLSPHHTLVDIAYIHRWDRRAPLELTYTVVPRGPTVAWAEPVTSRPQPANGTEAPGEEAMEAAEAVAVAGSVGAAETAEAEALARKLARKREKEQRRKHKHHRKRSKSKSKSISLEPILTTEPTDDVMKLKLKLTPAFTALRLQKESACGGGGGSGTLAPSKKTPPDQDTMSNLQTLSDAAVKIRSMMGHQPAPAATPQVPATGLRVSASSYPNTLANLKPNLCLRNIPNPSALLQRHRQHHAT